MKEKKQIKRINDTPVEDFSFLFDSKDHFLLIYTIFSILFKMRKELGLGAMLEYMEKYLSVVGLNNKKLKGSVNKVMSVIDIEKIYLDTNNSKR